MVPDAEGPGAGSRGKEFLSGAMVPRVGDDGSFSGGAAGRALGRPRAPGECRPLGRFRFFAFAFGIAGALLVHLFDQGMLFAERAFDGADGTGGQFIAIGAKALLEVGLRAECLLHFAFRCLRHR